MLGGHISRILEARPRTLTPRGDPSPEPQLWILNLCPPAPAAAAQVHELKDVPTNVRELLRGAGEGAGAKRTTAAAAPSKPKSSVTVSKAASSMAAAYLGRGSKPPTDK